MAEGRSAQILVRVSDEEHRKIKESADALGLSVSAYVRMLATADVVEVPASEDGRAALFVDTSTAKAIEGEMKRWGTHLSEALKAWRTVAKYGLGASSPMLDEGSRRLADAVAEADRLAELFGPLAGREIVSPKPRGRG